MPMSLDKPDCESVPRGRGFPFWTEPRRRKCPALPAIDWFILGFYLLGTAMVGVFVGKFVRKS